MTIQQSRNEITVTEPNPESQAEKQTGPRPVVTLAERYGGTVVPREVYNAMVEEVCAMVKSNRDLARGTKLRKFFRQR